MISKALTGSLKFIDGWIISHLEKSELMTCYKMSLEGRLHHFNQSTAKFAFDDLNKVDTKSGPLLSHVSLMITVLALFLASPQINSVKKTFICAEMTAYIIVALCCLRCIHVFQIGDFNASIQDVSRFNGIDEYLEKEAALKTHVLEFANGLAMIATVVMVVTFPFFLFL